MILRSLKPQRTEALHKICALAPQRRIVQSEDRTAVWCYIVKTHANEHRLSSFRVGELFLQRVPSSPNIFMLRHFTSLARARLLATNICAIKFVSYTLYVLEYPFSLFFGVNRVFAKVRFKKFTSSKIVPKVRFAVNFRKKGKNVLYRR